MPFRPSYGFCFSSSISGSKTLRSARDLLGKCLKNTVAFWETSDHDRGLMLEGRKEHWVERVEEDSVALEKSC